MEEQIIGIISWYPDNTASIWAGELSDADQSQINRILEKYRNSGCSVRGSVDELKLKDVIL